MEAEVTRFREERDEFLVVSPLSLTPETVAMTRALGNRPAPDWRTRQSQTSVR